MLSAHEAMTRLGDAELALSADMGRLVALNEMPPGRSRELSLAITNVEQGLLWLRVAIVQIEDAYPEERGAAVGAPGA
jgi:hypothetical protein